MPATGHVLYLDTSALLSLAYVEAGQGDRFDEERSRRLTRFCRRLAPQGGTVVCSILAFEEIAAVIRRESFQGSIDEFNSANVKTMRELDRVDAAAAQAAREAARDDVIEMLDFAFDALRGISGILKHPWGGEPDTASQGESIRRTHRDVLERYPGLDSMDALHITFGVMLGCTHLVSFDRHWSEVEETEFVMLS